MDFNSRKVWGAKADKVRNATSGHLAGLDSNGNLTDSGVSPTEDVTVEGNPVTFNSPFEQDTKSVVVSVKPIQDLHGYDHPWVGGAGKNKLPLTVAKLKELNTTGTWDGNVYTRGGVAYNVKTDDAGNITAIETSGTASENTALDIYRPFTATDDTYILNGCPANGSSSTYFMAFGGNIDKGSGVALTAQTNTIYIFVASGQNMTGKIFYPMIRLATESDSSFAPYSNECPISGIEEVEIEVSGKNLLSAVSNPFISSSNARYINLKGASVKAGDNVTISFDASNAGLDNRVYVWVSPLSQTEQGSNVITKYDSDDHTINIINGHNSATFSINNNGYLYVYAGGTIEKSISNVQLELGTQATAYEPYNPNSHTTTIPLPSTLYDADVDVTDGSGDENNKMILLSDIEWAGANGTFYNETPVDIKHGDGRYDHCISDCYKTENKATTGQLSDGALSVDSSGFIQIKDSRYATTSALISAMGNTQLLYELATPTTISFDPTILELLKGTNVVTTNGESVELTYGKSFAQAIDEIETAIAEKLNKSDVADIEGDTASRAYSVNDFMLRADGFYKVTAPIAQNASITSSNTTKTTIGAVLTALLNA